MNPGRQRVLIDRELYLLESWFADRARLADAGVPAGTVFATKPEWKTILNKAGVRDGRLHDARHTAATLLIGSALWGTE